jgi:hypothetical protein
MSKQLTPDDFKQSLGSHVALRAAEIRAKYGPEIGWSELLQILEDRWATRYPCEIVFDAAPLLAGELSFPEPRTARPADGFIVYVHPSFSRRLDLVPRLVLYQLVAVNYGPFASPDDAEVFGAGVLGISRDEYYEWLCRRADEIQAACSSSPIPEGSTCGGGCGSGVAPA